MTERRKLIIFLVFFLALLFIELPGSWLFDPDETRYAEISSEMLVTGDFVTPRLNGALYFEKPPLLYWMNAASMKAFGETPYAARLPTRFAAAGTAALLLMGLSASASTAGLWAALAFLSAPLSFILGRVNITDGLLTFSLTLAFFALRRFLRQREAGENAVASEAALGVGLGLGVLSKGVIGIFFPAVTCLAWVALHRKWRLARALCFSWTPWVFLLIAAPWFVMIEKANPGFSRFFFIHEHFARFATTSAKRPGPPYFFIGIFLLGFLPWDFLFAQAARPLLTLKRERWRASPDASFFAIWFLSVLVFFSLSKSKLIPYILPAFPAACALAGIKMAEITGAGSIRRWHLRGAGFFGLVYLAGVFVLPRIAANRTDHDLAVAASRLKADTVVCYEAFSNGFPLLLHRRITAAKYDGEFPSVGDRPKEFFWSRTRFLWKWNSPERVVALVRKGSFNDLARSLKRKFIIGENRKSFLVANFNPKDKTPLPAVFESPKPLRSIGTPLPKTAPLPPQLHLVQAEPPVGVFASSGMARTPDVVLAENKPMTFSWWKPAVVGTVALGLLDHGTRNTFQGGTGVSLRKFGRDGSLVERLGRDSSGLKLSGGFYLAGALMGSERAKRIGVLGVEALAVSGLLTEGLEHSVGRRSPSGNDADHFHPLKDQDSFPSAHTVNAFTIASVVAEEYSSIWMDSLCYGLAGAVGVSRVSQDHSWGSDVAAGALLGVVVGKSVVYWERKKGWSKRLYTDGRSLRYEQKF